MGTMTKTSSTIILSASPETVWATLARFEDVAQWGRGVSQSSLLGEVSSGVGAVRRVQVGRAALRETVIEWEPSRALAYTIEGLPAVVRSASNSWSLTAHGTGTSVTLTGEVSTKVGRVLDAIVARKIGSANRELLTGLEHQLRTVEPA